MIDDLLRFSAEEIDENNLRKQKLIDFIKSGDAILMAGAGCSGALYPAWSQLIDSLEAEALAFDADFSADKGNFLIFADRVKECLGDDRYYAFIDMIFRPGEVTHLPFHKTLCALPFKGFLTTNYDQILEHALNETAHHADNSLVLHGASKSQIHEFCLSLNINTGIRKKIVHLHGRHNSPMSIILGGQEYVDKYGFSTTVEGDMYERILAGTVTAEEFQTMLQEFGYKWPIIRKLLWSFLATRRLLFIGFSMSDPYFIRMFDDVMRDISTYNSEAHFLLLRVTPSSIIRSKEFAKKLKREYGIITVFFEDEEGKHSGLGNFIMELDSKINLNKEDIPQVAIEQVNQVSVPEGDEGETQKLFGLSKNQADNED